MEQGLRVVESFLEKFRTKQIFSVFSVLNRTDKLKLQIYIFVQFFLSLLDVLGVFLIAAVISLSLTNGLTTNPKGVSLSIFEFTGLLDLSLANQIAILGTFIVVLLISKTILALFSIKKLNGFMSFKSAEISGQLLQKLLSTSLREIQSRDIHSMVWGLTQGVIVIFSGVIARLVLIFTDLLMIAVMFTFMFFISPFLALSSAIVFGSLGLFLFLALRNRASHAGIRQWRLLNKSNQEFYQVLSAFREVHVKNRGYFLSNQIKKDRMEFAQANATLSFLPNLGKYSFEAAVTLGALLVATLQFAFSDSDTALVGLGVFLASSSRIAPGILRIQTSAVDLKGSLGSAGSVLELMKELKDIDEMQHVSDEIDAQYPDFIAQVSVKELTFMYPGTDTPVLRNLSFELLPRKKYAVVGPSGSGKSTLVDLILGLREVDSGSVTISGLTPRLAISKWPGAIAYVPQDVVIINGTIAENISFGYPVNNETLPRVKTSAVKAQLSDVINDLPLGLDSPVGDRGGKLSGGQRQRLGIARALFTSPKLLILDEATSALDGKTEDEVASAILGNSDLTVITIAHRISTMMKADYLIYIDAGRIVTIDTFEAVRSLIPDFDEQIKLMGTEG